VHGRRALAGPALPSVEAAVYFCCTEAIHNADRHSGGSIISVRAADDEGPDRGLRFSVSDDGHGFDPSMFGRV
jgi:signal transduction histidine kinase